MASLTKRKRIFQVTVHHEQRRYKLPGFRADAIGEGLSGELGRNVEKLLACKAGGAIPPDLRRYVETLPAYIRRSMAKQGIIDAAAEGKALAEHVADFIAALTAGGRNAVYVANTRAALLALADGCKMLGDVTGAKIRAFLAARRADRPKMGEHGNPEMDAAGKVVMRPGISACRYNAILTA